MSDNIKVVVKVRPLISRENSENFSHRWDVGDNTLVLSDPGGRRNTYTFDKVYNEHTKTQDVYNDVAKPIVEAFTTGINGTIFAYGQTSSGKTYTMMGTEESPGIIKLAVLHLFDIIKATEDRDFLIRVSYMEIYNEDIRDLLNIENSEKIKIQDKPRGGVMVTVKEEVTRSPEEIFKLMEQGEANRHIGATNMNEKSSRSHTIFQITIESTVHATNSADVGNVNVSQLNLVDLAGSERPDTTGAIGTRFIEGTFINRSLSTLTLVIKQLSEGNQHVSYRDSKLTRLLQLSLGGNAKTSIICAVTPAAQDETISTLQFALRAKNIKNKPTVNEVVTQQAQDTKIHMLNKKIAALQAALDGKRNVEQVNQNLQMKLKTMQSQILTGPIHTKPTEVARDRRRTWCAPRGDSLDTSLDAAVPAFCTPALKYNPALLPPMSFVPISSRTSRMATVPEEAGTNLLTPPKVQLDISGEIINIDSDDDDEAPAPQRESSCSPYHHCYAKRGTPPCVLRELMKKAEQEKIEIMELTDREKIYPPEVNELLPKLEENTRIIKQLQDKVTSTESSMKSLEQEKEVLKSRCDELQTLITDMEVSYETLKTKSKNREQELLSLLENQTVHHKPSVDKSQCLEKEFTSFMNLSKDFSLVCSDNEKSIVAPIDVLQTEINEKSITVEQLKADLQLYKEQIVGLESTVQSYENDKKKISVMETDIDSLNNTIQTLKGNLEMAYADLDSYKIIVRDLQLKISEKDENRSHEIFENLISNEKKISANNENIQNSIETLQNAVHNKSIDIEKYEKLISEKDNLIAELQRDIVNLNTQSNNHLKEITRLTTEKDNLETRIIKLNNDICSLTQSAQDDKKKIQDLTAKLDDLSSNKANLEKHTLSKLHSIRQTVIEVTALLTGGRQISVEGIEDVALTYESLNSILSSLKTALSDDLQMKINELLESQNTAMSSNHDLKMLNTELNQEIHGLRRELIEMKDENVALKKELNDLNDKLNLEIKQLTETKDEAIFLHDNLQLKSVEYIKELAEISESLKKSRKENEQLKVEMTNINKLLESHNAEMSSNDDLIQLNTELNQNIHHIRREFVEIKDENVTLKKELNDANIVKKQLAESIESLHGNLELKSSEHIKELDEIHQNLHKSREENEILKLELLNMSETHQAAINSLLETINENCSTLNSVKERHCEELVQIRQKNETISKEKVLLEEEISYLKSSLDEVQRELLLKKSEIISLKESVSESSSTDEVKQNVSELLSACVVEKDALRQLLIEKENEILHLKQSEATLRAKGGELIEQLKLATTYIVHKDEFEKNIQRIVCDITAYCQMSSSDHCEASEEDPLQVIYSDLNNISDYIKSKNNLSNHEDSLSQINAQVLQLSNENENLRKIIGELEVHKSFAGQLNLENNNLKNIIHQLENKKQKYDDIIDDICNENSILTSNLSECNDLLQVLTQSAPNDNNFKSTELLREANTAECNKYINSYYVNNTETPPVSEPKSLNSLCYSIIRDVLIKDIEPSGSTAANELTLQNNTLNEKDIKIQTLQTEIKKLQSIMEFLRNANKLLIEENNEVKHEIQLLIEPTLELSKKIASHRTNLSTLTATTYAENKMLKTKVKVLKYHHNRLHNVCRIYLPAIRTDLTELQNVLLRESDLQNNSPKRYSLPNVLETISSSFISLKNDTTLDGDALMLDSNFTLTLNASMDNTLVAQEDTFMDPAQVCADSTCNDPLLHDFDALVSNNQKMAASLQSLQEENLKLKQLIDKDLNTQYSSTTSEPYFESIACKNCIANSKLEGNLADALARLNAVQKELRQAEENYKNLELEIPSSENLVKKIAQLQGELDTKLTEIDNFNKVQSLYTAKYRELEVENENLSTQVMDSITEVDDLRKKVEDLEEVNKCLENRCIELEMNTDKDAVMRQYHNSMSEKELKTNLDNSSRYNKICSLQNELLASKEDSKKITEEVATIKNHLDHSDFSLPQNIDDTMEESNIFFFTKKNDSENTSKISLGNVIEEALDDPFIAEKSECLAYYSETTETQKENIDRNIKVIDLMKMLHHKLTGTYTNEVENLNNRLRQFEHSKNELEAQMARLRSEHADVTRDLEHRQTGIDAVSKSLNLVRTNIEAFKLNFGQNVTSNNNTGIVNLFKNSILQLLDKEFSLATADAFESLINNVSNKHESEICVIIDKYKGLENRVESINVELSSAKDNLSTMQTKLSKREEEYTLLKTQKEKVHEISQAVTLDIVKRELELGEIVKMSYQSLIENNILNEGDIDLSLPTTQIINVIFGRVMQQVSKLVETISMKDVRNKEFDTLFSEVKSIKAELQHKEEKLFTLRAEVLTHASSEHENHILIQNLKQELSTLRVTLHTKDSIIKDLNESQNKKAAQNELEKVKIFESEIETLKAANEILVKEKHTFESELCRACSDISELKQELEVKSSQVTKLSLEINKNVAKITSITAQSEELMQQLAALRSEHAIVSAAAESMRQDYENKCQALVQLQANIKTHEKTAIIQTGIINRLQKQKKEDGVISKEKDGQLQQLQAKHDEMMKEINDTKLRLTSATEELENIKIYKDTLEMRVSELEGQGAAARGRASLDARGRRQTIHDAHRNLDDARPHDNKVEAVFGAREPPDDLFVDADDHSGRSSPSRRRRRDSLHGRVDQSDRDDDPPSRPSSVCAARRRRQSVHDLHRSALHESPRESLQGTSVEEDLPLNCSDDNGCECAAVWRRRVAELRARCRELDEECDGCAEHQRAAEDACARLKREKTALENTVTELRSKLKNCPPADGLEAKPVYADAAVNTDQDWAHLHSVVVDRMSYDAAVERCTTLTRAVEEFRARNRDLKAHAQRLERALARPREQDNKELEATKSELQQCRAQLDQCRADADQCRAQFDQCRADADQCRAQLDQCRAQLEECRERCRELDEECDTCSQYLRERDDRCSQLKAAKEAAELKLRELTEGPALSAARKKRQSLHDANRGPRAALADAHTDTDDLSSQVDRAQTSAAGDAPDVNKLNAMVQSLSREKAALERRLQAPSPSFYVATGSAIVQNQQMTDVMKENQKLKKTNAKLIALCKKRGKVGEDQENIPDQI